MLIHREPLTPAEEAENARAAKIMQSSKPVPYKTLDLVIKAMIKRLIELEKAIEARFEMLEEQALRYRGVHDKSRQYNPGDVVTARGALWFCEKSTRGIPGTADSGFRLMHKSAITRGQKA
jgi:hypothetical protein